MIPEIKKILYATDLSETSRYAFAFAASLANRYDAKITILHVIEDASVHANTAYADYFGEKKWKEMKKKIEKDAVDLIKKRLDQFCEEVSAELAACPFVTDEIVVKRGKAVTEILNESKARNCDVVVMGTHGQGGFVEAIMGSTARSVMRHSRKPVVVIPLPKK